MRTGDALGLADSDFRALSAIRAEQDPVRRRRLVQRFAAAKLGMALAFARRWKSLETDQRDNEQAAVLGLLVAISRWDPARAKGGFSSYAHRAMASHILRGPVAAQSPVHVPRTVREDRRRVDRALRRGVDADPAQLAAATGLAQERVELALGWNRDRAWAQLAE